MDNISKIISRSIGGYSIGSILSALLTFLICLIVVRLVLKLCSRLLSRANRLNERLQKVILTSLKTLLYLLTIIITAEALGINTSSLTAIMSVLTLGVTLAAEDILGNVAGGLVILFSHPFSLGDEIEVGGTTGTVREISLTHTKIETPDGQIVLQPNREMSSSKIINFTRPGPPPHRLQGHSILRRADGRGEAGLHGRRSRLPRRAERTHADGVSLELRCQFHRIHHPLLDGGRRLLGHLF